MHVLFRCGPCTCSVCASYVPHSCVSQASHHMWTQRQHVMTMQDDNRWGPSTTAHELEVLSVPHMFWSAPLSADQPEDFSDQHWSELEILLPQPFWVESNSAMAPLRVNQHWSVHSALNHWNQFSCWVTLNRTEFYTSITAVIILIIKKKCMNKWTIAFKYVTWLSTDNITTRPYSNYKTYNHYFVYVILVSTVVSATEEDFQSIDTFLW